MKCNNLGCYVAIGYSESIFDRHCYVNLRAAVRSGNGRACLATGMGILRAAIGFAHGMIHLAYLQWRKRPHHSTLVEKRWQAGGSSDEQRHHGHTSDISDTSYHISTIQKRLSKRKGFIQPLCCIENAPIPLGKKLSN